VHIIIYNEAIIFFADDNILKLYLCCRKLPYRGIIMMGTITLTGGLTRDIFDPDVVSKEIQIIKNELHCNA